MKTGNLKRFNEKFHEDVPAARGIVPAYFFLALVPAAAWALERSGLGVQVVWELKRRYFVFIQEPVLSWHVFVFLQTFVLKLGVSLALIAYLLAARIPVWKALSLDRRGPLPARFYGAFFAFAAVIGVSQGFDPLAPAFPMHSFFGEALLWGNLVAVFSIIVVAPAAEEVFFRGFLYPAFNRAAGAAAAVVFTSILFAAAHARPDIETSTLIVIFLGSIAITLARVRTGSTRASIRLHALYNATILAAGILRYAIFGY